MTEKELRSKIKKIFESQTHQSEAIMEIYKLAIPDLDSVKKVNGFPESGRELWKFICKGFIRFDRKHHPKVFAGGIWLNNGFATNDQLSPWEVSLRNCTLEY